MNEWVLTAPVDCRGRSERFTTGTSRRAVLYLHGWNDYFFQVHLAQGLAEGMGARSLPLPHAFAAALSGTVRAAMGPAR